MNFPAKLINKYGDVLNIRENGKTINIKGILQPFHYAYKSYFTPKRLPAGVFDGRHYLLITSPKYKNRIFRNSVVEKNEEKYRVKSAETYSAQGRDLYVWAVLTACTTYTEDDYE